MAKEANIALQVIVLTVVLVLMLWLFQYVWNWTVPEVFGGKKITLLQALAILFLASVLFSPVIMVNCKNSCPKNDDDE